MSPLNNVYGKHGLPMPKIIFFFLAWIGFTQVGAQQFLIDSLKKELSIYTEADTNRVNLLNEISYQNIGIDYYQSRDYATQALTSAEQLIFKKGIATAKNRLALCAWVLGDGELAVEQALHAISISENENFYDILAESYRILGVTYTDQNDMDKAQHYIQKAETLCLLTSNWSILPRVYVAAGLIYSARKQYDSALVQFNKSLQIAEQEKNTYYLPVIYTNIGAIYGGDKKNRFLEMDYYYKALSLSKTIENKYAQARVLSKLGSALVESKKYHEAEKYLLQSQQLSQAIGLKMVVKDNLMQLMNLKMMQGKLSEAQRYMKDYYDLKDSLLNEKKTRQIVELETRYEIEKKEKAIDHLKHEQQIQTIWRNVLLIGLIGIAIASMVIYRLQKLRTQKTKELLSVQKSLNDKLKETDLLKSRFFANISHEFRTPLTLIAAPIEEKLYSPSLSEHDKMTFQLIYRNTNRLLTLVNQLLDLSKLEIGKMQLHIHQGNLNEFLSIVVASFDSFAQSKKIHFSKSIVISEDEETWYDSDKLEKIINNLLFNAFKFTEPGGAVTLSIYSEKRSNDVLIKISDTGKGISKEELPHVFSPFYQSRNTADDGQPGTGLGLSLVKELVNLYGGTIELVSLENKGTTVTTRLPMNKERFPVDAFIQKVETPETRALFNGQEKIKISEGSTSEVMHADSVLIIEDNNELRNFISLSLKNQFTILTAKDGVDGFILATEQIPSLIISDVMMPRVNGIELTEKLKSDERTSHIPVVLLTAKADAESRLGGFKMGADDYLTKPFSTIELHVRVNNLIEQRKRLAAKFRNQMAESPKPSKETSLDEKFVQRAKAIVEANLSDYTFSVEKMAEEIHLSRTQLFRKLKGVTGLSPNEFINNIRLQKAAKLILAKADTVSQIGYSVGFNDQSYFAKRFRKKFGKSPSEFSNQSRN
jgi:signal transduction histidine kinase/DNA-binding response OmpR family regulator